MCGKENVWGTDESKKEKRDANEVLRNPRKNENILRTQKTCRASTRQQKWHS